MMKKKMSLYKKSLLSFFLVLLVLQIIFLTYVYNTMILYEKNNVETFVHDYVSELKTSIEKGDLGSKVKLKNFNSKYEDNIATIDGYKEIVKNKELIYKDGNESNSFDIYADDKKLFSLELDGSKHSTKLGLLKIIDWGVKDLKTYDDDGLYSTDIFVTNDLDITINGKNILKEDLVETTKIEEIKDVYKNKKPVKINHYKVKNLVLEPLIKVMDRDKKEIKIEQKENGLYALNIKKYNSIDEVKDIIQDVNPLEILETWSLFMTNDASFNQVVKYFVIDSEIYNKAIEWANGKDKWFTPAHYKKDDLFTEENVKNITFYGDNFFSVEVKFLKTVYLKANNEKRTNLIHEMLYFIKDDGKFKLVDMKSMGK